MLNLGDILPLPTPWPELTAFLETRRSNLAKLMREPGPNPKDLMQILNIAARVPDHRKLAPWRFIVFQGQARADMGTHIRKAFISETPNAPADRQSFEAQRMMRAPLIIAVISAPIDCPRETPKWEQTLSAGAVCYNMLLAAQSLGYGAQWLTEWFCYNEHIISAMGLNGDERVAGLIYMGRIDTPSTERARPNLQDKLTYWEN